MVKKIVLVFFAVVAVLVIYAAVQNPNYTVERSVVINAPAEKIFPHMNSQKAAEKWGPWMKEIKDGNMVYSGPDEGVGSKASWNGNNQLGEGSAEIVETVPNQKVTIKLEYKRPFEGTQMSDYLFAAEGTGTKVTWKVAGQNNFVGRFMCIFMNMDKMVGGMFEEGLANLKKLVEAAP